MVCQWEAQTVSRRCLNWYLHVDFETDNDRDFVGSRPWKRSRCRGDSAFSSGILFWSFPMCRNRIPIASYWISGQTSIDNQLSIVGVEFGAHDLMAFLNEQSSPKTITFYRYQFCALNLIIKYSEAYLGQKFEFLSVGRLGWHWIKLVSTKEMPLHPVKGWLEYNLKVNVRLVETGNQA